MKVKLHQTRSSGLRPGSARACVRDAKDGSECWFDVPAAPRDGYLALEARQWAPAERMLFFRFPEEADNGRYGAWVAYDDIVEKDGWLLDKIVSDAGRAAAAWVEQNWEGTMPEPLRRLVEAARVPPPGPGGRARVGGI